jgi:pimeloyl-ACP methyl ester carboxylesterase
MAAKFCSQMTSGRARHVRLAAAAGLPALLVAGAAVQRHHRRRIERDPEQAALRNPPAGRPLAITSADGTRLHAESFGADSDPPVVLVHGWTEMLGYWTQVIDGLGERGLRAIAYDLRGHGQSEPAAGGDYSIERFGEDLEAVLDTVLEPGERALVAGHSLGAMSIAAWAEHHDVERRACAAALMNTGVGDLIAESLLIPLPAVANLINRTIGGARFMSSRAPIPRFSTPISHAMIRYAAFGPAASPAQVAFYERMLVACPPDVRADVGFALSELELSQALPRLSVPTLVLAGARDRLTPPGHAQRIAQALPDLHRLIVLEDTGHMAPLERPRAVTEALAELAGAVPSP